MVNGFHLLIWTSDIDRWELRRRINMFNTQRMTVVFVILECLQLEAARIVTGLPIYSSAESLYFETGWVKLEHRRKSRKLCGSLWSQSEGCSACFWWGPWCSSFSFLCCVFYFVCLCLVSPVSCVSCVLCLLCLVYPILPVSLECPFLITPSVFTNAN